MSKELNFKGFDLKTAKTLINQYGILASSFLINIKRPELCLLTFTQSIESSYGLSDDVQQLVNGIETVEYFIPKLEEDFKYLNLTMTKTLDSHRVCSLEDLRKCKEHLISSINYYYANSKSSSNLNSIHPVLEKYVECSAIDPFEYEIIANPTKEFLASDVLLKNLNSICVFPAIEASLRNATSKLAIMVTHDEDNFSKRFIINVSDILSEKTFINLTRSIEQFLKSEALQDKNHIDYTSFTIMFDYLKSSTSTLLEQAKSTNLSLPTEYLMRLNAKFSTFAKKYEIPSVKYNIERVKNLLDTEEENKDFLLHHKDLEVNTTWLKTCLNLVSKFNNREETPIPLRYLYDILNSWESIKLLYEVTLRLTDKDRDYYNTSVSGLIRQYCIDKKLFMTKECYIYFDLHDDMELYYPPKSSSVLTSDKTFENFVRNIDNQFKTGIYGDCFQSAERLIEDINEIVEYLQKYTNGEYYMWKLTLPGGSYVPLSSAYNVAHTYTEIFNESDIRGILTAMMFLTTKCKVEDFYPKDKYISYFCQDTPTDSHKPWTDKESDAYKFGVRGDYSYYYYQIYTASVEAINAIKPLIKDIPDPDIRRFFEDTFEVDIIY